MKKFFSIFTRARATFKRIEVEAPDSCQIRRARVTNARETATKIADQIAENQLAAIRATRVQIELGKRAGECRAEMLKQFAHDGDGSVNHVTSLGVHLAGIECAMRENLANTKLLLAASEKLNAGLRDLRAEIARDVAAIDLHERALDR